VNRSLIISSVLHALLIFITAMSLPFLAKKPLDIPPIVSVELIQIAEKTNIPFAPKAKKIIEKVKEKEKKLVSEQAPPKKVEKTKTKTVVSLDQNNEKIENLAHISARKYPKMNEVTRKRLIDFYKPYNKKLNELLQTNFDWDK